MREFLLVGVGGFIGAVSRFGISSLLLSYFPTRLPAGTLLVNLLGCLLVGYLSGLTERHLLTSPQLRLLLFTGVLGGFTTFSAFGLETVQLLRRNDLSLALLNVLLSVVGGIFLVWVGFKIGEGGLGRML